MHSNPLPEILILIAAAVGIVALFRLLKLSPVLGYLVAGALIGPYGAAWIRDVEDTAAIAELGVVFLLFIIGLELSFVRLKAMRRQVFGIGSAQLLVSGAAIAVIAMTQGTGWHLAIIIGGGLALSSTALVMQVLEEGRERASPVGRLSLAILILQDLAVMPLLVLVPLLAQPHDSLLLFVSEATAKAVVAMLLIFVVGRLVLRPLYRFIASLHNEELFVATTLLVVLGMSWLTESIGLSLALGAFMAGLLVAETEFQHQVEADVRPYKGLLMGLFFMTVGMRMDVQMIIEQLDLMVMATVLLLSVKASIIWLLLRLFRYGSGVAIHTALLLSQGGEFGFILFALAGEMGAMSSDLSEFLLVTICVTMALTPMLAALGKRLANRHTPDPQIKLLSPKPEMRELEGHVVVAGYGRMGKLVSALLESEHIHYVALEGDAAQVTKARREGKPVFYGDALRGDVLNIIGTRRARAIIITFKNDRLSERLVKMLRAEYPNLPIICRSRDVADAVLMEQYGAHYAVPELFEGSLQLGASLLRVLGIPEHEIRAVTQSHREEAYEAYDPQRVTKPA